MTPIIEVHNLSKKFTSRGKSFYALRNINLAIHRGEVLGLVGESGCGKSTIAKTLMQIYQADEGSISFQGKILNRRRFKSLQGDIQLVFQDPASSLNPRMTAEEIIREPLDIYSDLSIKERNRKVLELLELVGLKPYHRSLFPHEFSGGQKQRISIARALILQPQFLILDEPISALDLSIQAQIISLLEELQKTFHLTYLFISHDLAMVKHISTRVAVMYMGEIVEIAEPDALFNSPKHPYTKALIDAIPRLDPDLERERKQVLLRGEMPNPYASCPGCPFASRCPKVQKSCYDIKPTSREVAPHHWASCHLHNTLSE